MWTKPHHRRAALVLAKKNFLISNCVVVLDFRQGRVSFGHRRGQGDDRARCQETIRAGSESVFCFFSTVHHFRSLLLYGLVHLLLVRQALTQPSSEGSSVKLRHPITSLSRPLTAFFFLLLSSCPFFFFWFVLYFNPSADLRVRSSICTWEGGWQRGEQGWLRGENGRREEQNRVALRQDGTVCQPQRARFETYRAVVQPELT